MYFDAVLDNSMQPIFNGTPDETRNWLLKNPEDHADVVVCEGQGMKIMTVSEYLEN